MRNKISRMQYLRTSHFLKGIDFANVRILPDDDNGVQMMDMVSSAEAEEDASYLSAGSMPKSICRREREGKRGGMVSAFSGPVHHG